MPPELELLRQWLERAAVDLRSAEVVLSADPPITHTACFHSQQAAERTLKGFLAYRGVEFEHTHQIERLVQQCAEIDPELAGLHETADHLTAYAVRFRYPYPGPAPSHSWLPRVPVVDGPAVSPLERAQRGYAMLLPPTDDCNPLHQLDWPQALRNR